MVVYKESRTFRTWERVPLKVSAGKPSSASKVTANIFRSVRRAAADQKKKKSLVDFLSCQSNQGAAQRLDHFCGIPEMFVNQKTC